MKASDTFDLPESEEVSEALQYLAFTDAEMGKLSGAVQAEEYLYKQSLARQYLAATGTVPERDSSAKCDPDSIKHANRHVNAITDLKILQAKRKTAELTIDVWRSINASRRQGQ